MNAALAVCYAPLAFRAYCRIIACWIKAADTMLIAPVANIAVRVFIAS